MATTKTKAPANTTRKRTTPADAVDEQLARYRSMRDFKITAEPAGKSAPKSKPKFGQLPFVIQKHAASHLHYDFRLGWAGVLKSWACAKGPSYNVKDRRLAVQVEDHPMEYGGFEGIIPKGQYGGGTVMVWDQGTWWPQPGNEDVAAALRDGHLKFEMDGTKMKGKWALIRMSGHAANKGKPNWLLLKEHDRYERDASAKPITDESPNSAVTGRSLDQIAAEEDHVWQSNKSAYLRDPSIKVPKGQPWHRNPSSLNGSKKSAPSTAAEQKRSVISTAAKRSGETRGTHLTNKKSVILSAVPKRSAGAKPKDPPPLPPPAKLSAPSAKKLKALPKEPQPDFISPQLALEATTPPSTDDWLHELKLDGYRIQARKSGSQKSGNQIALLTRKGLDWTHRMPAIAAAVAAIPTHACTLDGEVVVLGPDGNSSFADLQASFQNNKAHPLTYFVFDLLHLDGHNTRNLPLRDRKQLLAEILSLKAIAPSETGSSASHGTGSNALKGMNSTASKGMNPTASKGMNSTALKEMNSTALKEMNSTALKGMNSNALKEMNSTALKEMNSNALKEMNSTALKGTGFSPSINIAKKNGALAPEGNSPEDDTLRLSEDIAGDGPTIFHHACELHAEGIISKRADAPYRSSRSSVWLKSKCLREQEFVIAGYTLSTEGPDRIGSLLLAYYDRPSKGPAKLIYAGRTGTGFTQKLRRNLLTQLSKLHTAKPTVDEISTADRHGALWIKPTLVAQVRFATWTADNLVRQAAFLGLREDKSPAEVVREEPTVAPTPNTPPPRQNPPNPKLRSSKPS
jgi:DNA ligase D-like protein (predicted 3'-phosphoesterase)